MPMPAFIRQQLAESERLKEEVRRTDPERYRREYGRADRATNKITLDQEIGATFQHLSDRDLDGRKNHSEVVDRMYESFKRHMDQPTRLTASQFLKFEPLYSKELHDRCINYDITKDMEDELEVLSNEFVSLVNLRKPLIIVSDEDPNVVIAELPPVFMSINNKSMRNLSDALTELNNAQQLDDGVNGGVARRNIMVATKKVLSEVVRGQDWKNLRDQMAAARNLRNRYEIKKKSIEEAIIENKSPEEILQRIESTVTEDGGRMLTKEEAIAAAKIPQKKDSDAEEVCDFEPLDEEEW